MPFFVLIVYHILTSCDLLLSRHMAAWNQFVKSLFHKYVLNIYVWSEELLVFTRSAIIIYTCEKKSAYEPSGLSGRSFNWFMWHEAIGHSRYIKILTCHLLAFRVKSVNYFKFLLSLNSQKRLGYKGNTKYRILS